MIQRRPPVAFGLLCSLLTAGACSDDLAAPEEVVVAGVDLDVLFAEPTEAEIGAVEAEWATRSPGAVNVTVVEDSTVTAGSLSLRIRIVTHEVDGFLHVGAVVTSSGLVGPAPVVLYAHPGDAGIELEDVLGLLPLTSDADRFVWVVPAFRSEPLAWGDDVFTAQGTPSPWDRDVDDALALVDVALSIEPAADADRIGVLGFSRGAGVGLLMGIRDPRIDRIVSFFGPTDFFDGFVRGLVADALRGQVEELAGLDYLDQEYLQPLRREEKTVAEVRLELVRRSAVLFASDLPDVQLHHGTADDVVSVSQAESLVRAMEELGRTAPAFEAYIYEGGGHSPLALLGSTGRATAFLSALLPTPVAQ